MSPIQMINAIYGCFLLFSILLLIDDQCLIALFYRGRSYTWVEWRNFTCNQSPSWKDIILNGYYIDELDVFFRKECIIAESIKNLKLNIFLVVSFLFCCIHLVRKIR
jgi:hypothetical protein